MNTPSIELQDILSTHFPDFLKEHNIPYSHYKVVNALINCRTNALGNHVDTCNSCGHTHMSYNSCRNRHCPKCQHAATSKWLLKQQNSLIDTQYFHVVFTLPDSLNDLFFLNQTLMYNLLFKVASETLFQLSSASKYLGARIGLTAVLHTWGQNLSYHPHLHCIVTGGGLNATSSQFIESKKDFFLPVRVLSDKFRGKFNALLKQLFLLSPDEFVLPIGITNPSAYFRQLNRSYYSKEWVVYCKSTFKNPSAVLEYLSLYTHRIAISNSRILKLENGQVTFRYKDYKDDCKQKVMTLSAIEFIRRFMMHVLPPSFVKIRHYGLLSSRTKKSNVIICRKLLGMSRFLFDLLTTEPPIYKRICPICKTGSMNFSYATASICMRC